MSNHTLEYVPLQVKEYDYDPWVSPTTKKRWQREEELRKESDAQKRSIRSAFKDLVDRYDKELLDKTWNEEFASRDYVADFEDRQYL